MRSSIAFLSGVGTRWPPEKWRDPIVDAIRDILADIPAATFEELSMYFHALGDDPSLSRMPAPAVVLRRNRRENELTASYSISKADYDQYRGFARKAIVIVEGVVQVLKAVALKDKQVEEALATVGPRLQALKQPLEDR